MFTAYEWMFERSGTDIGDKDSTAYYLYSKKHSGYFKLPKPVANLRWTLW